MCASQKPIEARHAGAPVARCVDSGTVYRACRAHHLTPEMVCRFELQSRRSKVARGPSRSSRPTLLDHARLSQACSYNLILYWTYWSYDHPSGLGNTY
eukprot:6175803-Pleurochrysis_carterae.AAC.1